MRLLAYFGKRLHGMLSWTHVHVKTRAPLPLSVAAAKRGSTTPTSITDIRSVTDTCGYNSSIEDRYNKVQTSLLSFRFSSRSRREGDASFVPSQSQVAVSFT